MQLKILIFSIYFVCLPCHSEDKPVRVSVVLATQYISNPGSVLGHTFLRFHGNEKAPYLDLTFNYAAEIPPETGMLAYAFRGLFGFFDAGYSAAPFSRKVQEYNNMESRDLWEYELNLTPLEVAKLLYHMTELMQRKFKYHFVKENCSYMVLKAIEGVKPAWRLTEHFHLHTIPVETLKVLMDAGAVRAVRFQPSLRRMMYAKFKQSAHPDAEIDKFNYGRYSGRTGDEHIYEQLLLERSKKPQTPPISIVIPAPPHLGHNPFRVKIGAGRSAAKSFSFFELRPFVHDLMELDDGYTRFSSVELLRAQVRSYGPNRWQLNSATLFRLENLLPYLSYDHQLSYRFSANLVETKHFSQEAGGGLGWDLESEKHFAYSLVGLRIEENREFERGYKPMGWAELGYIVTPLPKWKLWLFGQYSHQLIKFDNWAREFKLIFEMANYLTKDLELKTTIQRFDYFEPAVRPQIEFTLSAGIHI